jgi:hypothetical protein
MGLETIKGLKKKLEAVRQEMKDTGEAAITEGFKEIFEAYPKLEAVRWTQYTPYFNDGEACTFSVNGFYVKVEGTAEDAGNYEHGFVSEYDESVKKMKGSKQMLEALSEIQEMDEMLEMVFGDHQQITVRRDGTVEQEEYSHD